MTYVIDYCTRCGKEMKLSPELAEWVAGCVVCDDCPFEEPPCETCGNEDCKGECCDCDCCVNRKRNCEPGYCRRFIELCDAASMSRVMRDMVREHKQAKSSTTFDTNVWGAIMQKNFMNVIVQKLDVVY